MLLRSLQSVHEILPAFNYQVINQAAMDICPKVLLGPTTIRLQSLSVMSTCINENKSFKQVSPYPQQRMSLEHNTSSRAYNAGNCLLLLLCIVRSSFEVATWQIAKELAIWRIPICPANNKAGQVWHSTGKKKSMHDNMPIKL